MELKCEGNCTLCDDAQQALCEEMAMAETDTQEPEINDEPVVTCPRCGRELDAWETDCDCDDNGGYEY